MTDRILGDPEISDFDKFICDGREMVRWHSVALHCWYFLQLIFIGLVAKGYVNCSSPTSPTPLVINLFNISRNIAIFRYYQIKFDKFLKMF